MIETKVLQDTKYLVPNKTHKNFTFSEKEARKGLEIEGNFKIVNGERKGEPFAYRLFFTKDGDILMANKVEGYEKVALPKKSDVTLKAIDLNKSKLKIFTPTFSLVIGGTIGYLYAKKKNLSDNDLIKYAAVGAVSAFSIHWIIKNNTNKL